MADSFHSLVAAASETSRNAASHRPEVLLLIQGERLAFATRPLLAAPGRTGVVAHCCTTGATKTTKHERTLPPLARTHMSVPCYDLELGGLELPNTAVHVFLVCIADNVPNAYPLSCTAQQQGKRVRRTRDVRAI